MRIALQSEDHFGLPDVISNFPRTIQCYAALTVDSPSITHLQIFTPVLIEIGQNFARALIFFYQVIFLELGPSFVPLVFSATFLEYVYITGQDSYMYQFNKVAKLMNLHDLIHTYLVRIHISSMYCFRL